MLEADRSLLEGLLAVRAGLLDPSKLNGALREWGTDTSRPLGQVLQEVCALDEDADKAVDALSDWYVKHYGGDVAGALVAFGCTPLSRFENLEMLSTLALDATTVVETPVVPPPLELPATEPMDQSTIMYAGGPQARLGDVAAVDSLRRAREGAALEKAGFLSESTETVAYEPARVGAAPHAQAPKAPMVASVESALIGGRYCLKHLQASGNLGEVYLARDNELGRDVALKRIKAKHADYPEQQAQFVIEARVTGGLDHPGIVPVYSLGKQEDGRPFYAMRLIKGESLRQAINRFHQQASSADSVARDPAAYNLALRGLIRRIIDVCYAMAFAHSRGVIHRDLKPANIMLGPFGETLVVDWGLAKTLGRVEGEEASAEGLLTIEDLDAESSSVGLKGTVPYMSPEQARGEPLSPSSDIYSLGGTLYSLLTGRLPYDGSDSKEILSAVKHSRFLPPRSMKKHIPAPLEAICMKAMAAEPSQRYRSARAMAMDLERWLADERVEAHKESWFDRIRRWARHHRLAVGVTGAALCVLALASIPLALLFQSEARARRDADKATLQARASHALAEGHFRASRRLVDKLITEMSEQMAYLPSVEPLRLAMVEDAATRYQKFLLDRPGDRDVMTEGANVLRIAANTSRLLEVEGSTPIRELYARALGLYETLSETDPRFRYKAALTLIDRAEWNRMSGRIEAAQFDLQAALNQLDKIPANARVPFSEQLVRGMNALTRAQAEQERGRYADSIKDARAAIAHLESEVSKPGVPWFVPLLHMQAKLSAAIAERESAEGSPPGADQIAPLVADAKSFYEAQRNNIDRAYLYAATLQESARRRLAVAHDASAQEAAFALYLEALRLLHAVYINHHQIPQFRRALASAYLERAQERLRSENLERAAADALDALKLVKVADEKRRAEDVAIEASVLALQTRVSAQRGENQTARELAEQALGSFERALAGLPHRADLIEQRDELAAFRETLAVP